MPGVKVNGQNVNNLRNTRQMQRIQGGDKWGEG